MAQRGRARRRGYDSSRWVERLARFGLACRGVLYLVIAALAVNLARGRGAEADQRGALEDIAHHPFGHLLVLALAVGFAGLALWQVILAATSHGPRATQLHRVVAAGRAVVYMALAAGAIAISANRPTGASSDTRAVDVTARVMRHTLGRTLVGVADTAVCVVGVVMISKALRRGYRAEVKMHEVPARLRRAFEAVGMVGMTARGVIVVLLGSFVVRAAVTFNPAQAKGLDGALRTLVRDPYGPWLLVLLAIGLACFGLFSLLEVRYART